MEYWKEIAAVLAVVLAIVANFPYIRDILRYKTKPHLYTWVLWSITTIIIFFGQLIGGAGLGIWPTLVTGLFTVGITVLALRYGTKNITRSDTILLITALLAIIPWMLTNDPLISVVLSASINVIAYIPTIRKTLAEPGTETGSMYSLAVLRHALSLIALAQFTVTTAIYPASALLSNLALFAIILYQAKHKMR